MTEPHYSSACPNDSTLKHGLGAHGRPLGMIGRCNIDSIITYKQLNSQKRNVEETSGLSLVYLIESRHMTEKRYVGLLENNGGTLVAHKPRGMEDAFPLSDLTWEIEGNHWIASYASKADARDDRAIGKSAGWSGGRELSQAVTRERGAFGRGKLRCQLQEGLRRRLLVEHATQGVRGGRQAASGIRAAYGRFEALACLPDWY